MEVSFIDGGNQSTEKTTDLQQITDKLPFEKMNMWQYVNLCDKICQLLESGFLQLTVVSSINKTDITEISLWHQTHITFCC